MAAVVDWRLERARDTAENGDSSIDLDQLRKRKALADTELAELAVAEAQREVVPIDMRLAIPSVARSICARVADSQD